MYFSLSLREHVSFLCHTSATNSGKGKTDCHFTLGQAYSNMGGTKGNDKIHYQLFTDDTDGAQMEEMLKEAGREARGKRATYVHLHGDLLYSYLSTTTAVVKLYHSPTCSSVRQHALSRLHLHQIHYREWVACRIVHKGSCRETRSLRPFNQGPTRHLDPCRAARAANVRPSVILIHTLRCQGELFTVHCGASSARALLALVRIGERLFYEGSDEKSRLRERNSKLAA